MLKESSEEEATAKFSYQYQFGSYSFAEGWFLHKKLLGRYEGFRATEVCWVHPMRTFTSSSRKTALWKIKAMLVSGEAEITSGDKGDLSIPPANTDFVYQHLNRLLPWAFFGYTDYLKECWMKFNALFTSVVDKRVKTIRSDLADGTAIITSNGTLAVKRGVSLPTISSKFVPGPKGKMERVYFEVPGSRPKVEVGKPSSEPAVGPYQ
jgi:hypothetical protein